MIDTRGKDVKKIRALLDPDVTALFSGGLRIGRGDHLS